MFKQKYYSFASIIFLSLIALFGFYNKLEIKENVIWSDKMLGWDSFVPVKSMSGDFHASIYSEIYSSVDIMSDNFKVYAYMDPNLSKKVIDSSYDDQLLIHEQYHFNITEYHARLLRKAIVTLGEEECTTTKLNELYELYEERRDSMQDQYDEVSNHNTKSKEQRFWELKIDDLLRKTSYYKNTDIYSYYNFAKRSTLYYRHIYHTLEGEILTSYPIYKKNIKYGESYKIVRSENEVEVHFFKNGKLSNGGLFKTAITKISNQKEKKVLEYTFYDPYEEANENLTFQSLRKTWSQNDAIFIHYFNKKKERVADLDIYESVWKKNEKGNFYSSYFNRFGKEVLNSDKVAHERRIIDSLGRTVRIESYNTNHHPVLDIYFVSIYVNTYNKEHKITSYKYYNTDEIFATHKESYNFKHDLDERGNIKKVTIFDVNDVKTVDKNGVFAYRYNYDLYDNNTSIKRYNRFLESVLGIDDVFHTVKDYNDNNKIIFEANYYDEYTLKFDDDTWGASTYEYPNDSVQIKKNVDAYNNVFESDLGVGMIKNYFNRDNYIYKSEHFNSMNKYAKTENEIVKYLYKYDKRGNTIEETTLDSLGIKKAFDYDVATVKWKYDSNNNKILTTYYTVDEELANANQNITYNSYKYNNDNQLIERSNFDKNWKPELLDGVFKTETIVNRFGFDSIVKDYNNNGKLKNGVCLVKYMYNNYGSLLSETLFNKHGVKVTNANGYNSIYYNYNEKQEEIKSIFYNEFGKKTNNKNGICTEERKLDNFGYLLSQAFYDKNNEPVISTNGYYKIVYKRDLKGEAVEVFTYGKTGELINDENGIAKTLFTRAKSGLIASEKYYDKNDHAVEDSDGASEIYYEAALNGLYYIDKQLNIQGEEVTEE